MQPAPSPAPAPGPFTPWELLVRTVQVWRRNALRFTAVALILDLPLVALDLRLGGPRQLDPRQVVLVMFASWFVWLLTTAALSFGVAWSMSGQRPRVLGMLAAAVQQLWPVFTAGGTYTLLVILGAFAMVLPGVFLLVAGYVAIPAAIARPELGVEGALRRSVTLTHGSRLALLGAVLALGLLGYFGPGALGSLLEGRVAASPLVEVSVQLVADAVLSGLVCACPAVAYHALAIRRGEPAPTARAL